MNLNSHSQLHHTSLPIPRYTQYKMASPRQQYLDSLNWTELRALGKVRTITLHPPANYTS